MDQRHGGELTLLRRPALVATALLIVIAGPVPAWGDGLLEGISGDVETRLGLLSTKTTDASGASFQTDTTLFGTRVNLRVNYDLLPNLNLNAGVIYDRDWADQSGDLASGETVVTNLLPSIWLTLRDPIGRAAIGYDARAAAVKLADGQETTLRRDSYSANLYWQPVDFPSLQLRYARATTGDDRQTLLDTTEDYAYLKVEYLYRGLRASYLGTYLRRDDAIRDILSQQWSQEVNLAYAGSLLDGRILFSTDNTVTFNRFENVTELPLPAISGLSSLDDTPGDGPPLAANPALVDGNLTAGAGLNIGFPGPGGDVRPRNLGLDFRAPGQINRLRVWIDGWGPDALPADIANWFSWDVYTSTDNVMWTFHATVAPGAFGVFDRRFDISFPAVTTRYIKVVTRPLPGGVIGSTDSSQYPTIFITEVQGFVDRTAQQTSVTRSEVVQNYNVDVRVVLLRAPSLYYRLNAYYFDAGSDAQARYNISNGLFLTHRFNPILSTSANASFEFGSEQGETRTALLYNTTLTATPLRALTSSLVFAGNNQRAGDASSLSNSVALYNTAQLYRGIDTSLNLGVVFASDDPGEGDPLRRRDLYLNAGATITPHPVLSLTAYYLGKVSNASGGLVGGSSDTTENRLDLTLSFSPFRTLTVTAAASITSKTGQDTRIIQNYGLTWAPFPDGRLQFSFYYAEDYLPEHIRTIQPTVRFYVDARRRSYLEATYQFTTSDFTSPSRQTESHLFSTSLRIFF